MQKAFDNIATMVNQRGTLFISIYNDQGLASKRWLWIKEKYVQGGKICKFLLSFYTLIRQWTLTCLRDFAKGKPFKTWRDYSSDRGMSAWHDVVDWAGGYPFEVAKPEEVFEYFKKLGFQLERLKTCMGGIGCNEFVFKKAT